MDKTRQDLCRLTTISPISYKVDGVPATCTLLTSSLVKGEGTCEGESIGHGDQA
jgi:hypothetical protein